MSMTVTVEVTREFDVAAGFDEAFALLADVPRSASHFPKVDQLVDLGDNTYRWEMKKLGVDKYAIQTVYASHYEADKDKGEIRWTRVDGVGNGLIDGCWKVSAAENGTHLNFCTNGKLDLPFPSLMKMAISPVLKHEFNALVDKYVANLQQALS